MSLKTSEFPAQQPTKLREKDLNARLAKGFVSRSQFLAERDIPVVPVPPKQKGCILKEWNQKATTDSAQLEKWNDENAAFNTGAVAKPDGICVFDGDHPGIIERIERETGHKLPSTLTVQGSKPTPLGHYYFKQTARSRALGNRQLNLTDDQGREVKPAVRVFDFQQHNKYVVGPGSTHPSGSIYAVVDDSEIIEIPDWLCEWIDKVTRVQPQPQATSQQGIPRTPSVADVATRLMTRDLSQDTEGSLRALSQSMGFAHRHQADLKLAIHLVRCSGMGPEEQMRLFQKYKLHQDRPNGSQYDLLSFAKAAAYKAESEKSCNYGGDGSDFREFFPTDADCGEEPPEMPIIEGLIFEDTLNMFAGPVGHHKTWAALALVKALVYGEPAFGTYPVPKPTPVLYLCPDMSRKKLRKRMKMFGLDKDSLQSAGISHDMFRFRTFKEGDVIPLDDPRMKEASKGRVVICDTMGYFADLRDENQAAEFKKLSVPCRQLIASGCVTIILIHHSTKGAVEHDEMTLESFVKGSYQIAGLLDDCYGFLIVDEKRGLVYVKCIKPRSFEERFAFVLATREEDGTSLLMKGRLEVFMKPEETLPLREIKEAIRGNSKAKEDARKRELFEQCKKEGLKHRQIRDKFKEAGLKISDQKLVEWGKELF
jgi:Bifunctional DNA primase/polymerase, N-terminal/AAA domain